MELADLAWTDVEDVDTRVALVPVGSTEQHGPHAPLGTDTILAEAVAKKGAAIADQPVIIGPTLPIGIAAEHREFAGTFWLEPDTFRRVLTELCVSAMYHGWDRIIIVNGHGGNSEAVREVAATVSREHRVDCTGFTWFEAIDLSPSAMGHGGTVETSALLATAPDQVKRERLQEAADGSSERWGTWVGGTNLAVDADEFTENGVVGDPTDADAEWGGELLSRAGSALAEIIAEHS